MPVSVTIPLSERRNPRPSGVGVGVGVDERRRGPLAGRAEPDA
jgi:hypothetical protein